VSAPLTIGAPPDFESDVLMCGLDVMTFEDGVRIVRPDRLGLVDGLRAGELDLALLPVHLLAPCAAEFEVVPGIAVSSKGPYGGARLDCRVPLPEVTSIASRASGHAAEALVQVLFGSSGRSPALVPWPGGTGDPLAGHDAVLVAGDAALVEPAPRVAVSVDLGVAWSTLTGQPMVWEVWAARQGRVTRRWYAALHGARTRGRRHLPELARHHAAGLGAPETASRFECFGDVQVSWRLGQRELEGLSRFWRECRSAGLLPGTENMRFLRLGSLSTCLVANPHKARKTI
jgi:chorismate dehydratase